MFAGGHLIAPGQLVKSLYCSDQGAASCYLGRGVYIQRYAAFPTQAEIEMPVLFLHPPASIEQTLLIPPDRPALSFAVDWDELSKRVSHTTERSASHVWNRSVDFWSAGSTHWRERAPSYQSLMRALFSIGTIAMPR